MRYFCGSCGKLVEEGDASRARWYPFDSKDCASAYGIRAGVAHVSKGDKANVGFLFSTTRGVHSSKAQAIGLGTRCARCSSEDAYYSEAGDVHSFTCYSCGLEYVELPDGTVIHSRDDDAKSYLAPGDSSTRLDGLRALRDAISERSKRKRE